MSELFRPLFHISILRIFPLHTDYGQDGADDDKAYEWLIKTERLKFLGTRLSFLELIFN